LDAAGFGDETVPGLAAGVDDVAGGVEDAAVSSQGMTRATPVSHAGQTAPMIQAEWWRRLRQPRGV
jgi:hypothetical protein